jgi:hypothetical protein
VALGAPDAPDGLRETAKFFGFASAFELEVGARLESAHIDVSYEGAAIRYPDAAGQSRRWTPDFRAASGVVLEAKGRVTTADQAAIAAVLAQNPSLDLRFVFQNPNRRGDVEGSTMTPAEWADQLGVRWTTLDRLALVTLDLPRVVLTNDGDRVVPGWQDDGQPAATNAAALWPPARNA